MSVVAEGEFADGLTWHIEAGGTEENFSTMLNVHRVGRMVSGSGMGGPKLSEGRLVDSSYGVTDDLPCTEVVRADPSVDRVVVTTDRGVELDVPLTEPSEEFGLRFGAVQLPAGQLPDELRGETAGTVVHRETQHGLRRRHPRDPGGDSFGWIADPG